MNHILSLTKQQLRLPTKFYLFYILLEITYLGISESGRAVS